MGTTLDGLNSSNTITLTNIGCTIEDNIPGVSKYLNKTINGSLIHTLEHLETKDRSRSSPLARVGVEHLETKERRPVPAQCSGLCGVDGGSLPMGFRACERSEHRSVGWSISPRENVGLMREPTPPLYHVCCMMGVRNRSLVWQDTSVVIGLCNRR